MRAAIFLSRRSAAISALSIAACAPLTIPAPTTSTPAALTPAQLATDINLIVGALSAVVPQIGSLNPALVPIIQAAISLLPVMVQPVAPIAKPYTPDAARLILEGAAK